MLAWMMMFGVAAAEPMIEARSAAQVSESSTPITSTQTLQFTYQGVEVNAFWARPISLTVDGENVTGSMDGHYAREVPEAFLSGRGKTIVFGEIQYEGKTTSTEFIGFFLYDLDGSAKEFILLEPRHDVLNRIRTTPDEGWRALLEPPESPGIITSFETWSELFEAPETVPDASATTHEEVQPELDACMQHTDAADQLACFQSLATPSPTPDLLETPPAGEADLPAPPPETPVPSIGDQPQAMGAPGPEAIAGTEVERIGQLEAVHGARFVPPRVTFSVHEAVFFFEQQEKLVVEGGYDVIGTGAVGASGYFIDGPPNYEGNTARVDFDTFVQGELLRIPWAPGEALIGYNCSIHYEGWHWLVCEDGALLPDRYRQLYDELTGEVLRPYEDILTNVRTPRRPPGTR
jgi:hypothetical protein